MSDIYNDSHRRLQDRFDTRDQANRIDEKMVGDTISDADKASLLRRQRYVSVDGQYICQRTGRPALIDFEHQTRIRFNGQASIDIDDPLMAAYPEAEFIVRVRAREVFANCPRYIHEMKLVRRSKFTPKLGNQAISHTVTNN